jgi:undecaprenyl pyrophosphate phosphatase UppP
MLVGCLIIFAVAWFCIRWIDARTFSEQLKVGAFWMVLMAIFEMSLGLAFGYSRERIFADYNVVEGRLMIFGMIFMLFAPALAAKARGFS